MKVELKPELNQENFNDFISENGSELQEGKDYVVKKLKKKARKISKCETSTDQEKEEARGFFKLARYLKECSPDKLMAIALLDKKSLSKVYNSPTANVKQKVLFHFASHENVKTLILKFREQYPNWKKAKGLLSQMEQNNNDQIQSELTTTVKKKANKKSLKRKKEMQVDGLGDSQNCEMPQSKRIKVSSGDNLSETEEIGAICTSKKKKMKQNKLKNKQNKMNVIEKTVLNGSVNTDLKISSPTGKFHRKSNRKQNRNWQASKRNRSQPLWKNKNQIGKDSANMIQVPSDWKEKITSPKTGDGEKPSLLRPLWLTNPQEYKPPPVPAYNRQKGFQRKQPDNANKIQVPSDWREKCVEPKKEDTQTTSLLRPAWLVNPQENKPAPSFKKIGGNFRGRQKH